MTEKKQRQVNNHNTNVRKIRKFGLNWSLILRGRSDESKVVIEHVVRLYEQMA